MIIQLTHAWRKVFILTNIWTCINSRVPYVLLFSTSVSITILKYSQKTLHYFEPACHNSFMHLLWFTLCCTVACNNMCFGGAFCFDLKTLLWTEALSVFNVVKEGNSNVPFRIEQLQLEFGIRQAEWISPACMRPGREDMSAGSRARITKRIWDLKPDVTGLTENWENNPGEI
jgi:hypothetical protein